MSYFQYLVNLIPGSTARSDQVDSSFQGVETALDAVEADMFQTVRLTDVASTLEGAYQIATPAVTRAGKLLGFDASGLPVVIAGVGTWEGDWVTATAYLAKAFVKGPVSHNRSIFICLTDHTSGTFATDLAAGKWELLIDLELVVQSIITNSIITFADSPYELSAGEDVMVDVSSGAVTLTLPATPLVTDQPINIMHVDGVIATNAITIARNGKLIMEVAQDMTVDVQNASFGLEFANDTLGWRVRGV